MRLLLCLLLVAGLSACDAFRPPDEPLTVRGPTRTFAIAYEVQGTYGACRLSYTTGAGTRVEVDEAVLAGGTWRYREQVRLAYGTALPLQVQALCADPQKLGKVTALVLVDGVVSDRTSGTGFGARVEARYVLHNPFGTPAP